MRLQGESQTNERLDVSFEKLKGASSAPLAVGVQDGARLCFAAFPDHEIDRRFEIGSVTKVFTGSLLGVMVEAGDVDPEAPVDHLFGKALPWPVRPPTLVELASHRSGLPNTPKPLFWRESLAALSLSVKDPWRGVDAAKYRAMLMAAVKQARVGEAPRYSSMGVSLLGDALAHAAGMDFADLLDQRLLRPLGIRRTDFLRPEEEPDLVAISVNDWDRPVPYLRDQMAPAGMLASTVEDQLRFLRAAWGEGPDEIVKGVLRAQTPVAQMGAVAIGYCWLLAPHKDGEAAFHNGGTWGSQAEVVVVKDRRIAVAALSAKRRHTDEFISEMLGA